MHHSFHPGSLQTPAGVTQHEWSGVWVGSEEEDVSALLGLSFAKWEKGKCEKRDKKGDLAKGFLRKFSCSWKFPELFFF